MLYQEEIVYIRKNIVSSQKIIKYALWNKSSNSVFIVYYISSWDESW